MIKNKVNPVAAEGTSSCEWARGRKRQGGRRGGEERLRRRRRAGGAATLGREDTVCSSLRGVKKGRGAADRLASRQMDSSLLWARPCVDRKLDSLSSSRCFMNYVAECWGSCMVIGMLLASAYSGDNECFITLLWTGLFWKDSRTKNWLSHMHALLYVAHALWYAHTYIVDCP